MSRDIINQRLAAAPLEVRVGAAVLGSGRAGHPVVLAPGRQGVRDSLAGKLGLAADQVHIITPDVGGGFGAKFGAAPEQR